MQRRDGAELFAHFADQRFHGGGAAQISRKGGGFDALGLERLDAVGQALGAARDERDREALGTKPLCHRCRNAGTVSANDDRFCHGRECLASVDRNRNWRKNGPRSPRPGRGPMARRLLQAQARKGNFTMPNSVDKIASGVMGAAKDLKAGFKGLTGVFMHLMEEHGKVGALIKRVGLSSDEGVRAKLFPTIRRQLLAHEKGEMKVVYPALAEFPETAAIAAEHANHATEIEAAIAELDSLPFGAAGWPSAFERLEMLVK